MSTEEKYVAAAYLVVFAFGSLGTTWRACA